MVTNLILGLGVMMIPVGFLLMTIEGISKIWIGIAGIIGFVCIFLALYRANEEDRKKDRQFIDLINELRGIREDINNKK